MVELSPQGSSEITPAIVKVLDFAGAIVLKCGTRHTHYFPLPRMENREDCKKVIEVLDKAKLPGNSESITVKFADSGSSRRKLSKSFKEGVSLTL